MNGDADSGTSRHDRILDAALEVFSVHGTSNATLQMVAAAAGVSVGLVQHHFGSKDGLIEAVDAYAQRIIAAQLTTPLPEAGPDYLPEMGRRVTFLLSEHASAVDYLTRQVLNGSPTGAAVFDALVAMGIARWRRLVEIGATPADLDVFWAAVNPLILTLGTIAVRRHLDRHLPEPFDASAEMQRWERSVTMLLRGQLRP